MNGNKRATPSVWVDPEDAPELTNEFFEQADLLKGDKLIKRGRGRPRGSNKTAATVRFDNDVLDTMKATGPGWQTRLNALMRAWLKRHKFEDVKV